MMHKHLNSRHTALSAFAISSLCFPSGRVVGSTLGGSYIIKLHNSYIPSYIISAASPYVTPTQTSILWRAVQSICPLAPTTYPLTAPIFPPLNCCTLCAKILDKALRTCASGNTCSVHPDARRNLTTKNHFMFSQ